MTKKENDNNQDNIQNDMVYQKHRCNSCNLQYTGHRSGSYHPRLKACYIRNEKAHFVKIGYWCPSCHRFYNLEGK